MKIMRLLKTIEVDSELNSAELNNPDLINSELNSAEKY
jgi:hypothetical protein